MQKISSYIYPNRVQVVSDTGYYPTEWRIVYQRTINIYKGMQNIIEFDIKNAQQKRISLTDYTLRLVIMDELNQEVCTTVVTPIPQTTGLASCIISADHINDITPQLLKYSLYILNNDGTKSPIYGDSQYGVTGKINLLNGAVPESLEPLIIDTFTYAVDMFGPIPNPIKTYYSEAVEVNPPNDFVTNQFINLEFIMDNLDADITVQITDFAVISTATPWYDLETFSVAASTVRLNKRYNHIIDYSNNIGWLRIKYVPTSSSGSIDKILVRL